MLKRLLDSFAVSAVQFEHQTAFRRKRNASFWPFPLLQFRCLASFLGLYCLQRSSSVWSPIHCPCYSFDIWGNGPVVRMSLLHGLQARHHAQSSHRACVCANLATSIEAAKAVETAVTESIGKMVSSPVLWLRHVLFKSNSPSLCSHLARLGCENGDQQMCFRLGIHWETKTHTHRPLGSKVLPANSSTVNFYFKLFSTYRVSKYLETVVQALTGLGFEVTRHIEHIEHAQLLKHLEPTTKHWKIENHGRNRRPSVGL